MSRFIAVDRDTAYLLPPSVDEWLPQNHLARFVVEVIDQLDLSELTRQYAGRGSDAYHPAMLLGLLVYGYATGLHSSRKIERACHDSVAMRFIAANTQPDHDSIATFRRRFLPQIEALFVQVLMLAREMKCLKLGTIALDGTKIAANASKHSALSWEHANWIEAQLREADTATMLVITAHVTQAPNDKREIAPALDKVQALPQALGNISTLLADTGHFSQANAQACLGQGIEPLLSMRREAHHMPVLERFAADAPAPETDDAVAQMAHRLGTKAGRALYGLRKQTVEPMLGIIKRVMGWRQMSMRGLDQARGECSLVTMAWNIKRLHVLRAA